MADTSYTTNDPYTVKLWSKYLESEVLKNTWAMQFVGTAPESLIMVKNETMKGPGDKITYALRMQMSGDGVSGDSTLEGSEEALVTFTDSIVIDQLRHAHRSAGRMTQQRVTYDLRDEARAALADWYSGRIDESWLNQIAGFTPQGDTRHTGNQAVTAPDSNHRKFSLAGATTDDSITSNDTFTLSLIDKAVEAARTATPAFRPLRVGGKPYFAAFLHDYQVTSMRTNTSTGQWLDIQKAAMTGGEIDDNPIFTGSLGVYNGVILHADTRIPQGVQNASSSTAITTVRRAVLCGAQAAIMGYGQENGPQKFTWTEQLFDYGNRLGVAVGMIWGLKKAVYNSADYATITMSSYAAAAA